MASEKKSIIVYSDWIETFERLTDEEAGKLIKHFFRYVNDLDPEYPDRITEISFIPMKQSLKRDLIKWEGIKVKRSDAGKKSAELRKQNSTNPTSVESVEQNSTNPTVSDSVSVSVNDILLEKETKLNIAERKQLFFDSLIPFIGIYGKDMLREFYEYWTEHSEKDFKFRKEKEKTFGLERRLKTWSTNNFNKNQNGKITDTAEFKLFTSELRANNPNI